MRQFFLNNISAVDRILSKPGPVQELLRHARKLPLTRSKREVSSVSGMHLVILAMLLVSLRTGRNGKRIALAPDRDHQHIALLKLSMPRRIRHCVATIVVEQIQLTFLVLLTSKVLQIVADRLFSVDKALVGFWDAVIVLSE